MVTADLSRHLTAPNVVVCRGPVGIHRRKVLWCPACKRRTPFVVVWGGVWYGTTDYCIVCLDGWREDWRMLRPFARGWRAERAQKIRTLWDSALLPDEYRRWVALDAHRSFCRDEKGECPECLDDPKRQP